MKQNLLLISLCLFLMNFCFSQSPSLQWAKRMGGSAGDIGHSVAVDALGNVYTTGYFNGTGDFDPGAGTANLTSAGDIDIFISKLDASGNFVWAKRIGGTLGEIARSITVDASGNVYVTGYFNGTVDFDPGTPSVNLTSSGAQDLFILKLNTTGTFVWAKRVGGGGFEEGWEIRVDATGNVYTTGQFEGTADFNPGAATFNLVSAGAPEIFILKLDATGTFVWAKRMGGTSNDIGYSLAVDGLGNVYTTGAFLAVADFDPGAGTYYLTPTGFKDIFVSKLDVAGNFVWARRFGGSGFGEAISIALDAVGNVYSSGLMNGTVDFDPGVGTFELTANGGLDVYISKLNTAGDFVWAKSFGGNQNDYGSSIAVDASNNVYTAGLFGGTVDFDPGVGTSNMTDFDGSDAFISKLDSLGKFVWAIKLGGTQLDEAYSLAVDPLKNIYLTGSFAGTADFDPATTVSTLSSAGTDDIFVVKLGQALLPLKLLSFSAKKENNANLLQWVTAQEINVDRFEIERSSNGREFNKIASVKAGNTNYALEDNSPIKGANFYRLKMMDKDQQFTYSPIRMISNGIGLSINIYPNPTKDNLHLQIAIDQKTTLQLQVLTQDGRVVMTKLLSVPQGMSLQSIDISKLAIGHYYLKVLGADREPLVLGFEKAP